jgi:tetratricopeptide (TPR) repeat protein
MSQYDQKNQRVENQYNADKIEININAPKTTGLELLEKGKKLLSTKSYVQAIKTLEQSLEQNSEIAEVHYYLSIALLRGNRPKLLDISTIRKIENHLQNAIRIQPQQGRAYVLWALIKYDFYVLNGMFDRPPSYQDLLNQNWSLSHSQAYEILNIANMDGNLAWQWLKNQL